MLSPKRWTFQVEMARSRWRRTLDSRRLDPFSRETAEALPAPTSPEPRPARVATRASAPPSRRVRLSPCKRSRASASRAARRSAFDGTGRVPVSHGCAPRRGSLVAIDERGERPRPELHVQRVLGRDEVAGLLACCATRYRPLVATALFTGMRISELLGLVWDDIDLDAGTIHVCAQLSRAHRGVRRRGRPPRRMPVDSELTAERSHAFDGWPPCRWMPGVAVQTRVWDKSSRRPKPPGGPRVGPRSQRRPDGSARAAAARHATTHRAAAGPPVANRTLARSPEIELAGLLARQTGSERPPGTSEERAARAPGSAGPSAGTPPMRNP